MTPSVGPTVDLYRYYGPGDDLLYVGISLNAIQRAIDHRRRGASWWTLWERCTVERFDTREQAAQAERDAIRSERPRYNIIHNRSRAEVYAAPPVAAVACDVIYDHRLFSQRASTAKFYAAARSAIDHLVHAIGLDEGIRESLTQDQWIAMVADFARYNVFADSCARCWDEKSDAWWAFPVKVTRTSPTWIVCEYICSEHGLRWTTGYNSDLRISA